MPDQGDSPSETPTLDTAPASSAVQARPKPKPKPPRPRRRKLPPYKLLLHNDEVNTMDDVVHSIVRITPLSPAQAIRKMLEAHHSRTSVLLATHKERAELYVQQFASVRIMTSLEPDA